MFADKTFQTLTLTKPKHRDSGEQKLFKVEATAIDVPVGARIVSVRSDDIWYPGEIVLHAIVDPNAELAARRFIVFTDGDTLAVPADATFLGVVVVESDSRSLYVYDLGR